MYVHSTRFPHPDKVHLQTTLNVFGRGKGEKQLPSTLRGDVWWPQTSARAFTVTVTRAVRERDALLIGFRGYIEHDVFLTTSTSGEVTSSSYCHTLIFHISCSYNNKSQSISQRLSRYINKTAIIKNKTKQNTIQ